VGKTIAITGGGAGLGLAMAQRLAADGHELFLLGRTPAKLESAAARIAEAGGKAHAIACDVGDAASVEAAFAAVRAVTTRLDVLINNAGVFAPFFLAEAGNQQIAETLNTNLSGPMFCSRDALKSMEPGGQILCIGSELAQITAAMLGVYQASKAGLERYCRTLDQEVGPQGIRVTLVRAGKMYGPDMSAMMEPAVAQRFTEESLKLGIDNRKSPISLFASVAEVIPSLLALPEDVHVPEIMLAGRHPR
jgi:meso-butanediol dehydrogenase / (S,S)-butanediol dehydrogenase / diacetyl reductase